MCDEHTWEEDGHTHHCQHVPLSAEQRRKRMWMRRESASFNTLSSLVQDKKLLKDLGQMGLFKHTGKELALERDEK